jgi:hypothetical protein
MESRIFFTAPWDPPVVRRGDALGLRALTDQFGEAVAPGFSNRIRDGRWVTILAWCLVRSHGIFHAGGGRSVETRAEQGQRYAWLRPLELMWVARTTALVEDWRDRSLPGQRSVQPWYEEGGSSNLFGMSMDQFRAYRRIGLYGGYRVAFRKWPELTVSGDGWTPGPAARALAGWLNGKMGSASPGWLLPGGENLSTRSIKISRGKEHQWWLKNWQSYDSGDKKSILNTLPRRKDDFSVLPERDLLRPLIFDADGAGKLRTEVARAAQNFAAGDHLALCKRLSDLFSHDPAIAALHSFSRLADAGMDALDFLAESLHGKSHASLARVAACQEASKVCAELQAAARQWQKCKEPPLRHVESANRLANAISSAEPVECLSALLRYHEEFAGGMRWFTLDQGRIETRAPRGTGASHYRFRLWSLCRLAAQCGVTVKMPSALLGDSEVGKSEGGDE